MKRIARLIRAATPAPFRKLIRRAGEFFGRDLTYSDTRFPSIEGSLETLRRLGLEPGFCVDVGAYHGDWTRTFKTVFPTCKILMVEAQEAKAPILQELAASNPSQISTATALLGPVDGQIVEFTEMETGSSVFAEQSPYERKKVERRTARLDSLLAEGKYPSVDFLKLDVQGYELQVLEGASEALAQATAVLLEASLVPINTGCPLISEVIAYLSRSGFRVFDFCSQIRRQDGVLWQTDLLFLRENSPIVPSPSLTRDNWG